MNRTTTTGHRLVLVDVLNTETHEETGRSVAVECFYVTEKYEYGADADGDRGERREDVTVLEIYAPPGALHGLSDAQVHQVYDTARQMVEGGRT